MTAKRVADPKSPGEFKTSRDKGRQLPLLAPEFYLWNDSKF